MYGKDYVYAASRLEETVVRLGEDPVVVKRVGSTGDVELIRGVDGEAVYDRLENLDLTPVRLGFVNYQGTASYIVRAPKGRNWKQGMNYNNILSLVGKDVSEIPLKFISRTIKGKYPKLEVCLKRFHKVRDSISWHRDWAVTRGGDVLYKGQGIVGKVVDKDIVLKEGYEYLDSRIRGFK